MVAAAGCASEGEGRAGMLCQGQGSRQFGEFKHEGRRMRGAFLHWQGICRGCLVEVGVFQWRWIL